MLEWRIGDVSITAVVELEPVMPATSLFAMATEDQVAAEASRMAAQARAEQAAASREKGDDNPYQPRVRAERGALIDQYA